MSQLSPQLNGEVLALIRKEIVSEEEVQQMSRGVQYGLKLYGYSVSALKKLTSNDGRFAVVRRFDIKPRLRLPTDARYIRRIVREGEFEETLKTFPISPEVQGKISKGIQQGYVDESFCRNDLELYELRYGLSVMGFMFRPDIKFQKFRGMEQLTKIEPNERRKVAGDLLQLIWFTKQDDRLCKKYTEGEDTENEDTWAWKAYQRKQKEDYDKTLWGAFSKRLNFWKKKNHELPEPPNSEQSYSNQDSSPLMSRKPQGGYSMEVEMKEIKKKK